MSITFYDGGNLSGRSAALRDFAWATRSGGQYIHPHPAVNQSGLARTVGGELMLHGLDPRQRGAADLSAARDLLSGLDPSQSLASLSGGQQVRMAMACALAVRPRRLAIDCAMEQLDRDARAGLAQLLARSDVEAHLCDNDGDDLRVYVGAVRSFEQGGVAGHAMNRSLLNLAEKVRSSHVQAPPLVLEAVRFAYPRGRRLFHDLTFTLRPGRSYVLKAPNGSGKSTLAKLLAGVLKPSQGRLRVGGRPHAPWASSSNLLFYAFQNPLDQIVGPRVIDYLESLTASAAKRPTFLEGRLDLTPREILALGGLEAFADAEVFDLPPVVAKRVSILAALVSRAPWLFFDEPCLGSDENGRKGLRTLINNLCAIGFGVVVVSHGTEFDDLPCARQISISEGILVPGAKDEQDRGRSDQLA